ncbi:MAG: flagellin Hag [Firmicutes bacterium]|nr:flagellin Hag [Candidatus Fermentithermobacillaceae bacterium]
MRINTNISALNAWKNLAITDGLMAKSLEKLSSGYRINRAADDAAGLAISEKMKAQTRGLRQAVRNAQDGISLIQTAEGALNEVHAILQRMRELVVQAGNGIYESDDLQMIQDEINQLVDEIDEISTRTEFNTKKLLDGTVATGISLQIGANAGQVMEISIAKMDSQSLGVQGVNIVPPTDGTVDTDGTDDIDDPIDPTDGTVDTDGTDDIDDPIDAIDGAIKLVSQERSKLGAYQNRLEHTINNLNTAAENLEAAGSRIRDVDMALEMANFTRHQILQAAGTAMLAQANLTPQSILKLLG